jgi:hypothetical protein
MSETGQTVTQTDVLISRLIARAKDSELGDSIYSEAAAELTRLQQANAALMEREWQPIESAPKDGSSILVVEADRKACIAEWRKGPYGSFMWRSDHTAVRPTHWMPLPAVASQ